jgi:hypothetical protein
MKVSRSGSEVSLEEEEEEEEGVDEEIGIKGTYLNAGNKNAEANPDFGSADGEKDELVRMTLLYGYYVYEYSVCLLFFSFFG